MSKLKKVLLMCTAYVLVAALAIGGTIAYLQDDDSDVNVMTLGNVQIEQLEYERAKNEDGTWKTATIDDRTSYVLQDFTQAKPLYPATEVDADGNPVNHGAGNLDSIPVRFSQVGSAGGQQPFVSENAQDKFVLIENTGKTDAYVRTLVAIECGTGDSSLIGILHFEPTWNINKLGKIVVDGVNYYVIEYVYKGVADGSRHPNGVLPAGDTTYPNLCQVYLKAIATNEDMEAIDGNDNGTLDILVLSQGVQAAGFADAETALNAGFGDLSTDAGFALCADWFDGAVATYEASLVDTWDGTADTSWYNESATTFTLTSAEQLAGMNQLISEGVTFAGKTINLDTDLDMAGTEWVVETKEFMGTFDGQDHTISNLARTVNEKTSGRMGLFAHVENGTVKNVTIDNAAFYGYGPYGGVVCGSAYGDCTFENITLTNCNNEMYNTASAGIVGLAYADSDYTFKGITIDDSNVIGSYWGSWDTPCGGLIGRFWLNTSNVSPILIEDCYVAGVMNVYNDVTANNQYYNYRYAGMLIGMVETTTVVNGTTVADPYTVTCKNVTVEYGDWANYRYCEWEAASSAYPHDGTTFQFYREDDNDFDSHVHTAVEDNHNVLLTFDQLFGGCADYVYGINAFDGVTVIYNN